MVLQESICVAAVMVALGNVSVGTGGKDEFSFSHVRGVAADQGNDPEYLGDNKQSEKPRTQETHGGGLGDHSDRNGCHAECTSLAALDQLLMATSIAAVRHRLCLKARWL
jgi:hypothetical protein